MALLVNMDYDTGDLSQFTNSQLVGSHGLTWVTDRRRIAAGNAGRYEVRPGDDPIDANGERQEIINAHTPGRTGSIIEAKEGVDSTTGEGWDHTYGWSTYFDSELLNPTGGGATNIFTQWHQLGKPPSGAGIVPLSFQVRTAEEPYTLVLRRASERKFHADGTPYYSAVRYDLGTLEDYYDQWTDFVFRVKWGVGASAGLIRCHVDGVEKIPLTTCSTMFNEWIIPEGGTAADGEPGDPIRNYFKQGYYRGPQAGTSVIWHDQTLIADSSADINLDNDYAAITNTIPPIDASACNPMLLVA